MSRQHYYTGVGSRTTPVNVMVTMTHTALLLRKRFYKLRSGGAEGADSAFEAGANGLMEIFLPYKRFNGRIANNDQYINASVQPDFFKALAIAEDIHPAWNACNDAARKLHARNCMQVLGRDLQTPSDFLICWTPDGREKNGTRTAIVLSERNNIPVYNLFDPQWAGLNADELVKRLT